MLSLWLNDERSPPSSEWVWVKTSLDAIKAIRTAQFDTISLDHDLGENAGTEYDVLLYLEAEVYKNHEFQVPEIRIHTANTVARFRMTQAVESIKRQTNSQLE